MMSLPFFISKRYTFSRKDSRFISLISAISIAGITLGVAALIITLSILSGFERNITAKIIDFDSHIKISSYRNILPDYHIVIPFIKKNMGKNLKEISPVVSNLAVIKSKNGIEGVNVTGVNNIFTGLRKDILSGQAELPDENSIIIGGKLANKLFIKTGDMVTIFALNNDKIPTPENMPNIERYKVTGIYESGMAEYDDLYAYVHISSAQKLFNIGDNVTGYNITVTDITKIDSLTNVLTGKLRYPHRVNNIYQIYKNIFTWIELQQKPIPIILGLITLVAAFNIIGTILMIVLEKTGSIGILKSLGAKKKAVVSIFLYQGIFLSLTGIIIGNLLAYLILILQLKLNIITLPASVYFISTVPIYLSPAIFLMVSGITFVLCLLVSFIPSYIAARITPVSSLRFK